MSRKHDTEYYGFLFPFRGHVTVWRDIFIETMLLSKSEAEKQRDSKQTVTSDQVLSSINSAVAKVFYFSMFKQKQGKETNPEKLHVT